MTDVQQILQEIVAEFARAEHIHPVWPGTGHTDDHVWAAAIVAEEAGETLQAALDWQAHGRGSLGHIHNELVQTGAMVVRALLNLSAVECKRNVRDDGKYSQNEVANEHVIAHLGDEYWTETIAEDEWGKAGAA